MYLKPETRLPVIYTDDVITGTLGLLEADNSRLTDRSYNLTSTSFSIGELVESVKKYIPSAHLSVITFFQELFQGLRSFTTSVSTDRGWLIPGLTT